MQNCMVPYFLDTNTTRLSDSAGRFDRAKTNHPLDPIIFFLSSDRSGTVRCKVDWAIIELERDKIHRSPDFILSYESYVLKFGQNV